MKIGIFGMGAVGCSVYHELYGYPDLYVLADEQRIEEYKKGFVINGKLYYPECRSSGIVDVLILCVKNYQLRKALSDMAPFVDKATVILPLLNGITAHDIITDRYRSNRVLYGVINVEANKVGNEVKAGKILNLQFGEEKNEEIKDYVRDIAGIFKACEIRHGVYPDMKKRVWLKWMLNIGINQVSALCNATYRDMTHPLLQELLEDIFWEVYRVSEAYRIGLEKKDVEKLVSQLNGFASDRVTSLTLDFNGGCESELDIFSPALIRLAEAKGIEVPINRILYKLLKSMEDNKKQNRLILAD